MAGRLVPQKDIPTALRAFSIFLKKVPKAGLVVVGEGSELKKLEILVKKLGLEKAVFFEGWQKDMLSYLKTSDIFFMTSTHEGYQRALGEAAAAGVPVVTTETGPVGSVYKDGDSVLSCPVGDVACLAQKLYLLVRDAGLREALVRHAKKVAHHAIAKDYEAYLAQYAKCIRECGKE
jgi:glycosyltransferase involved in cell wall biosynthesis